MASISSNIQFRDAGSVLHAFGMQDIPAFSIWTNRQLHFAHSGQSMEESVQLLAQWLEMLATSVAVYTVKLHKSFKGDIDEKTPYHGSFNFRLTEPNGAGMYAAQVGSSEVAQLRRELAELRAELSEPEVTEPENVPPHVQAINGLMQHVMADPDKYIGAVMGVVNKLLGMEESKQPRAVNGPPDSDIYVDLEAIVTAAPEAAEFIAKLAEIGRTDPAKLRRLIAAAQTFV